MQQEVAASKGWEIQMCYFSHRAGQHMSQAERVGILVSSGWSLAIWREKENPPLLFQSTHPFPHNGL